MRKDTVMSWALFIIGAIILGIGLPGLVIAIRDLTQTNNLFLLLVNVIIFLLALIPVSIGFTMMVKSSSK